jgi:hypothetical protein
VSILSTDALSQESRRWDERVAIEARRQRLIEAAFDRSDAYARLGDDRHALDWLDRAEALSGGLSPAYRRVRARLTRQIARAR